MPRTPLEDDGHHKSINIVVMQDVLQNTYQHYCIFAMNAEHVSTGLEASSRPDDDIYVMQCLHT